MCACPCVCVCVCLVCVSCLCDVHTHRSLVWVHTQKAQAYSYIHTYIKLLHVYIRCFRSASLTTYLCCVPPHLIQIKSLLSLPRLLLSSVPLILTFPLVVFYPLFPRPMMRFWKMVSMHAEAHTHTHTHTHTHIHTHTHTHTHTRIHTHTLTHTYTHARPLHIHILIENTTCTIAPQISLSSAHRFFFPSKNRCMRILIHLLVSARPLLLLRLHSSSGDYVCHFNRCPPLSRLGHVLISRIFRLHVAHW